MPLICSTLNATALNGMILVGLDEDDIEALVDDGQILLANRAINGLALPDGLNIFVVMRETYDEITKELVRRGLVKPGQTIIDQRRPT